MGRAFKRSVIAVNLIFLLYPLSNSSAQTDHNSRSPLQNHIATPGGGAEQSCRIEAGVKVPGDTPEDPQAYMGAIVKLNPGCMEPQTGQYPPHHPYPPGDPHGLFLPGDPLYMPPYYVSPPNDDQVTVVQGPNGYFYKYTNRKVCGECKTIQIHIYKYVETCSEDDSVSEKVTLYEMNDPLEPVVIIDDVGLNHCFQVKYWDSVKTLSALEISCAVCSHCNDEINRLYVKINTEYDFCSLKYAQYFNLPANNGPLPENIAEIVENSYCQPSPTQSAVLDCFWLGSVTGYNNQITLKASQDKLVRDPYAPKECMEKNVETVTPWIQSYQSICEILEGHPRNDYPFSKKQIPSVIIAAP